MSPVTIAQPKPRMNVDEFLAWAEGQPGRFELEDGRIVAMAPERARHAETKFAVQTALAGAIRRAGAPCHMLPDGMTVRIDDATAYEPDALVYCGDRVSGDAVEIAPIVVVEVLSPGTSSRDLGDKFVGYFEVPSIQHYLLVDPLRRRVIHHRRGDGLIETRFLAEGALTLEPPGLAVPVAEMFPS